MWQLTELCKNKYVLDVGKQRGSLRRGNMLKPRIASSSRHSCLIHPGNNNHYL